MSCATRQSGNDIHDFCCCHLWCWWSLFGEYCIRPRIVFYNITSEYNSTFVFLVLCLQSGILQMTDVHQWGKMNFSQWHPLLLLPSFEMQTPRGTTWPAYVWYFGSNSAFLRWQMSINAAKWTFLFSPCASRRTSFFAVHSGQLPCWHLLELLLFLVRRGFHIRNFHRLRHRNKLVHQIAVTYWIESFFRDVIFMIFW